MDGWIVWLLVACGFGATEVLSGNSFYLAPFAMGAALAAGADAAFGSVVSVIVFLVASVMSLVLLRPIVSSRLLQGPHTRTGAEALVGKQAVVLEPIGAGHTGGRVKIDGEVWSARTFGDDHDIPIGSQVHVVKIEGATALVIE